MRNWIPLIQQYNKIVPNKNVDIEPLSAFFMDFFFFIHFLLAVGSTRTFNVRAEDADICQFLFTYLIEKRREHDLGLKSELLSWKLQAIAIAKQLDFLVCFWEEIDLKWLRKWENSMNIVCRVGRGFQLLQAFYFNLTYL